jgi:phosphoribosylformylglycinamidine (FGAM) synthase-like amidotransferase family enzyme
MIDKQKIVKQFGQLIVITSILLFCVSADATWSIYKRIQKSSEDGHILRLDLGSKKPIRAWFILRKETENAFKSKLPLYQVDNNDVHDLQQKKNRKVKEDRWIRWVISDGNGKTSPDLMELMNGKELTFQYYLPDGTIKETTFSLEGAKEAIEGILK